MLRSNFSNSVVQNLTPILTYVNFGFHLKTYKLKADVINHLVIRLVVIDKNLIIKLSLLNLHFQDLQNTL